MRRRTALGSIAFGLVALDVPRIARAQQLDVIESAGPLTEDITNIFWAVKTGLFKQNGIDLELIGTNSGSAAMEAVVTGTYQLARVDTHYKETEPLVAELTKMDLANVAKIPRGFNATTLDLGQLQPLIDASAKYEHIARAFPARELVWEGFR